MRRIGIIGSGNFACAMARVIGANAAKNSTIHPLVWSISLSLQLLTVNSELQLGSNVD
jgi:glycerol-3-phosphate dehydrogenase